MKSLDYCYHTNNIEYVRFVLNTYDAEFLKTHEPTGLEIHYLGQSFKGERLDIEKLAGKTVICSESDAMEVRLQRVR